MLHAIQYMRVSSAALLLPDGVGNDTQVMTVEDYDLYCHYVAGLVGIGLSQLFGAYATCAHTSCVLVCAHTSTHHAMHLAQPTPAHPVAMHAHMASGHQHAVANTPPPAVRTDDSALLQRHLAWSLRRMHVQIRWPTTWGSFCKKPTSFETIWCALYYRHAESACRGAAMCIDSSGHSVCVSWICDSACARLFV